MPRKIIVIIAKWLSWLSSHNRFWGSFITGVVCEVVYLTIPILRWEEKRPRIERSTGTSFFVLGGIAERQFSPAEAAIAENQSETERDNQQG